MKTSAVVGRTVTETVPRSAPDCAATGAASASRTKTVRVVTERRIETLLDKCPLADEVPARTPGPRAPGALRASSREFNSCPLSADCHMFHHIHDRKRARLGQTSFDAS